jgi:riboflavin synthase
MFTGIIQEVGQIASLRGATVTVRGSKVLDRVKEGDSIAVDGACLTVVSFDADSFTVQVSPETFRCTTLGKRVAGDRVNLERAMAVGDRFDGHFVQGHVDGVGHVTKVLPEGDFQRWTFQAPEAVAKFLAPKGAVAIDGISLTVIDPQPDSFEVAIIPSTLEKTTLHRKKPGDPVNMEADIIGKQIYHYLHRQAESGITMEALKRYGFA